MADRSEPTGRTGGRSPSRPAHRRARLLVAPLLVVLAAGCARGDAFADGSFLPLATTTSAAAATTTTTAPAAPSTTVLSPLAAAITPAGSTLYDPSAHVNGPAPVGLSISGIGVRDAGVVDVGLQRNGELEIPAASEVGWYRFGPRPGEPGSAVLAAHIAFDGIDGVFRRLVNVAPGAEVSVRYADGTVRSFRVTTVERHDKDELPASLFATTGPAKLVLITCGGAFNRALQSYEDNIVVTAVPVAW